MALYQRIKDLREDADKTQSEIAEYLGTTAQYYGKYEKGEREIPFSRAIQLAKYYGVSLDYLAGLTIYKNQKIFGNGENALQEKFSKLSERSKGRVEQFVEQLCEKQEEQKFKLKEAK